MIYSTYTYYIYIPMTRCVPLTFFVGLTLTCYRGSLEGNLPSSGVEERHLVGVSQLISSK